MSYGASGKSNIGNAGGTTVSFAYAANGQRYKKVIGGANTLYYIDGTVEIELVNGETITRTYVDDIAVIKSTALGTSAPSHAITYTLRDRLGSVVTLTNHHNLIMEHRSYDPFGKPRYGTMQASPTATLFAIASGTPFTQRGFTDHEHLDEAQLIHMNGRVYDYNLGRFLSVDPFIQSPGNSQSFNPYSYIMNNPLAGTDPSGYVACAATDECGQKPKRKRESFSGGIVRNYIQVYRPAVNNGKAKSSSAKKTPDTSDVGSQQQVGGTNQKNGGALQARIKADAHNSIVRGGEDLGVEMGYGSYVNYGGVDAKWGDISLNENGHISSAEVLCDYSCQREAAEFGQITANDLSRAAMQISIRNSSRQAAVASGTVLAIPLVMVALPKVGTSTIVGLVKPFRKFGELPKAQKEACVGIALNLCGPGSPVDDLLKPKSPYTMPQPGPSKLAPAGGHIIHPRRFIDRSRASGVDG